MSRAVRFGFRLALAVLALLIAGVMWLAGTTPDIGRTVALVLLVETPLVVAFAMTLHLYLEFDR